MLNLIKRRLAFSVTYVNIIHLIFTDYKGVNIQQNL